VSTGPLVGAKLLWTVEHATDAPHLELLLSLLRVDEPVVFGLSVAHLVSIAAIALGAIVIARPTRRAVSSGSQLS
jgi:hypothetical protein